MSSPNRRFQPLRAVFAHVRFRSVEPLLEDLGSLDLGGIQWIIVGDESRPDGIRRDKKASGQLLTGQMWDERPKSWRLSYYATMKWDVKYTDEFEAWWSTLKEVEQDCVAASVGLLEQLGPSLRFPYSSGIATSRHDHMPELRVQHQGEPYHVLYAFDPRRMAILLVGGKKTSDDRWYDTFVPLADRLYDEHLALLKKEGFL